MNTDILLFFGERPAALPLYEALEKRILDEIENVTVKVQKTQISFANGHNFAFASFLPARKAKDRPKTCITVTMEPFPNSKSCGIITAGVTALAVVLC